MEDLQRFTAFMSLLGWIGFQSRHGGRMVRAPIRHATPLATTAYRSDMITTKFGFATWLARWSLAIPPESRGFTGLHWKSCGIGCGGPSEGLSEYSTSRCYQKGAERVFVVEGVKSGFSDSFGRQNVITNTRANVRRYGGRAFWLLRVMELRSNSESVE